VIVDCEVYLQGPGESFAGEVFGMEALINMCRGAGVDRAVLMPTPSLYPRNRQVAEALDASADGRKLFVGCALMNPRLGEEVVKELEQAVKEWGFRVAKLMPTLHAYRPVGATAHPVMRKARELGIPVTIHSGESPAHPLEIGVLAESFPDVPIIMDHMGYRSYVGEAIAAAKRASNIYLMTTAVMEPHFIRQAVQEIGADRVVYGSNGPAVRPATQLEVVRQAGLSPEEERKVLGDNAGRLLKL
jgi:predicted TIM-barrel fold metal-dependent hydrolase